MPRHVCDTKYREYYRVGVHKGYVIMVTVSKAVNPVTNVACLTIVALGDIW